MTRVLPPLPPTNVLMMGTNDELTEEIRIAAASNLEGED